MPRQAVTEGVRLTARDLIVVGGGAGGLVVASGAAQLGLRVTLVERQDRLGGDCLHYGCVPSKTLLHAAHTADRLRRASTVGLTDAVPGVDMGRINARIQSVISEIQRHDDPERFRSYGCEVLFGAARLTGPHEVQVGERLWRGRRIVIATGSRPAVPAIDGLEEAGYLTSQDLFSLPELPGRLAVLGGGPIGVEMGQAFARLGSRVTILEGQGRVLPLADPEGSEVLGQALLGDGVDLRTAVEVLRIERSGDDRILYCRDRGTGAAFDLAADAVLVATGRAPNVEGLGLEAAGVEATSGGIVVDRRMRSSRRHIFACGDVCGPYRLTHMAEYQAGIIIRNAVFRIPAKADYGLVPQVVYTDPEVAQVGMSVEDMRRSGPEPTVVSVPFADNDRAITGGRTRGFVRLHISRGRLRGAVIVGPHAGELIHELALGIRQRVRPADIVGTIHAYPTLAQTLRHAAGKYYVDRLFSPGTRAIARWINRILP